MDSARSLGISDAAVRPGDFMLQIIDRAAITTGRLTGELDLAGRQSVIDAFESVSSDAQLTCIDLAEVTFIDCAGLGALLARQEYSKRHAYDMTIAVSPGPVTLLLDLTDVRELFRTQ